MIRTMRLRSLAMTALVALAALGLGACGSQSAPTADGLFQRTALATSQQNAGRYNLDFSLQVAKPGGQNVNVKGTVNGSFDQQSKTFTADVNVSADGKSFAAKFAVVQGKELFVLLDGQWYGTTDLSSLGSSLGAPLGGAAGGLGQLSGSENKLLQQLKNLQISDLGSASVSEQHDGGAKVWSADVHLQATAVSRFLQSLLADLSPTAASQGAGLGPQAVQKLAQPLLSQVLPNVKIRVDILQDSSLLKQVSFQWKQGSLSLMGKTMKLNIDLQAKLSLDFGAAPSFSVPSSYLPLKQALPAVLKQLQNFAGVPGSSLLQSATSAPL